MLAIAVSAGAQQQATPQEINREIGRIEERMGVLENQHRELVALKAKLEAMLKPEPKPETKAEKK